MVASTTSGAKGRLAIAAHRQGLNAPIIAEIQQVVTAVPPSSAGIERVFSLAPHLGMRYRGNMRDERFERIVVVRYIKRKQEVHLRQ